ncbi:MAG: BTAD domain-containing putative transcriptional regulator [Anaerolineae bacterium]|jgi:DNA-binding SARP family transcriptional activator
MNRLAISLLGPLRVTLDGKPATPFEADTARALLAYLATHTEAPQRRETLAGLLWPEQPEPEALANLRQALKRLRGAIGDRDADPPFLHVSRKSIQFNPASDYWLDVAAFGDAIAASQEHRHRCLEACRSCMRRLAEAIEVYRGDFLAGFSLPSVPFEEWLLVQRERLHRQTLDALSHLAAYHERRGEWELAGRHARRQVELEPWRESAQRGLMRALALSGERGAALAQYEVCCRTLAEELGVEPEEETTALYERIRQGDELESLSPVPPCNLPTYLTPFVGREAVLAEIEERLGDPDCRLLSLVGPGGSGKTRLAVEAGAAQVAAFENGAFFVRLAPLGSVEAIVPTVARALGFSFYASEGGARQVEPRQQLLDYVRQKSLLLIMDNFEHLLDGVDLVTDILKTAPDVSILATSRARLNVQGEQLFPVAGMDVPDEEMLEEATQSTRSARDATQYSAVKLFLSSARRVQPDFELTSDNLADVARICRLVQGMPLGILLAAGWVEMLTPAPMRPRP